MSQARHQKRAQLKQMQSNLEKRQQSVEGVSDPDRPRNEEERRALVEHRIQEAMKNGAFDNLPGKGKPFSLNSNPFLEPGQELAFDLLKNHGFAPEWIERDKEIRQSLAAARNELRAAWQQCRGHPANETIWRTAIARCEEQLHKLNHKIDDFNLIVPIIAKQRPRLRLSDELRRAQKEGE